LYRRWLDVANVRTKLPPVGLSVDAPLRLLAVSDSRNGVSHGLHLVRLIGIER
jgi:hypothetical protein